MILSQAGMELPGPSRGGWLVAQPGPGVRRGAYGPSSPAVLAGLGGSVVVTVTVTVRLGLAVVGTGLAAAAALVVTGTSGLGVQLAGSTGASGAL